jgi:cytochrome c
MSTHKALIASLALAVTVAFAQENPRLGEPVTAAELALADYTVLPNGEGLPDGSGTATQGAAVYTQNCLACHGAEGTDGINDRLVGGRGSLLSDNPVRTIGSFWPYATTVFDYVRRAMSYQTPGVLSNDEIYSVTAYLLFLNGVIEEGAEMNAETLPLVKMPNRDNVVWDYRAE